MNSIAVIMSTYNGENYLKEQIESILLQEGVLVNLYIRDDGSKDHTVEIIKEYQEDNSNIQLIEGRNIGVGNSFMELLYTIPDKYDYYAFSDQDDIWEKDKLARAVLCLKQSGATLYASNQNCVDDNGKTLYLRYNENKEIHLTPLAIMSQNHISGCTFVFPKAFFNMLCLRKPSSDLLKLRIHDVWVAMAASIVGSICYDIEARINYRQHRNNVVGAKETTKVDVMKMQLTKLYNRKMRNGRSSLVREAKECFPEYVKDNLIVACANPSIKENKVRIIKERKRITCYSGETNLGFVMKVVLGLF